MTSSEHKNAKLRLLLSNVIFIVVIIVVLSIIAERFFSFDPLGIFTGMHLFSDKYPTLFFVLLFVYFTFAISKHWTAYKKNRRDNDLAWMFLLSIMAVTVAVTLVISFF